jgi:hypothetical protein
MIFFYYLLWWLFLINLFLWSHFFLLLLIYWQIPLVLIIFISPKRDTIIKLNWNLLWFWLITAFILFTNRWFIEFFKLWCFILLINRLLRWWCFISFLDDYIVVLRFNLLVFVFHSWIKRWIEYLLVIWEILITVLQRTKELFILLLLLFLVIDRIMVQILFSFKIIYITFLLFLIITLTWSWWLYLTQSIFLGHYRFNFYL